MTGGLTRFDTEETEKYPLFSIDLYNCQELKTQKELVGHLEQAVLSSFPSSSFSRKTEIENEKSMKKKSIEERGNINENESDMVHNGNDGNEGRGGGSDGGREGGSEEVALRRVPETTTARIDNIPDLNAMHLLKSTDNLCCIILAAWSNPQSYEQLYEIPKYTENIEKAQKLSVEGSYSDIIEKTSPNRMYYVFDVLLPNSLENPLLDYSKMF
jgi:hypothetical protein